MTSRHIYTVPYFYIIQHIPSRKLYAGSKWIKGSHPDTFMTTGGYTTSSKDVNSLIEKDGLDSFQILILLTEEECKCHVYVFETQFLTENNICIRNNWLNKHNNTRPCAAVDFTPELRKLLSEKGKQRIKDPEYRTMISEKTKEAMTPERRKIMSEKAKTRTSPRFDLNSIPRTPVSKETREKISKANSGRKFTEEHKTNLWKSRNSKHSPETIQKMKEGQRKYQLAREQQKYNLMPKPVRICPHCNLSGRGGNMTRFHFEKCKALKNV